MKLNKFLWILSGDDLSIIEKCSKKRQARFAIIGCFVFIIFVLCFVSSYFTFTMIFHNYILGVPASIFFSWMITNIYLLLLYTLTKNVLPHKTRIGSHVFSLVLRLGFISLLAVFISKPLEVLIFSNQIENEIDTYKIEQIAKHTANTNTYFSNETHELQSLIKYQKQINPDTITFETEMYSKLTSDKINTIAQFEELIKNSNYYIKGIVILNTKYPICWLFTFICVFLFLFPALMKRLIEFDSKYYKLTKEITTKLILEEYSIFKEKYNQLFHQKYNLSLNYTESYLDPPFNTIRKNEAENYLNEADLIKELYND